MTATEIAPKVLSDRTRLLLVAILSAAFIVFGLSVSGLEETADGLKAILFARDTLITDYVELGGVGAAFVNAGALTLIAVAAYWITGATVSGGALACLMLVLGTALYGKNLLNVWPILGGVLLYCRFTRERFANHINTAFFGCALAPVVSEILFSSALSFRQSIPLSLGSGLLIGFVLPPVAVQLFRAHGGYSLYNMGFVAGVVGSLIVAIFMSYGFVPAPLFYWSTDHTALFAVTISGCCGAMIVGGFLFDRHGVARLRTLLARSGQAPSDFIASCGDGPVLINMGLLGLLSTGYVLAIGGDLNGPVVGGILSIMGFGAFGKHVFNCVPVVAGVYLATVLKQADPTAPSVLIAALFSTTLAPISGSFGWYWGLLAGAVHVSAAQTVGALHGGLSLYNNGFAAGFVAALIAPVALALNTRKAPNA
ncbi:MAG: DUF1576 domain-containing protein [Rhodobacteraceae bacterium]|nr:DUF1576 domain-containing protein [Paracoccaceae bacterium]